MCFLMAILPYHLEMPWWIHSISINIMYHLFDMNLTLISKFKSARQDITLHSAADFQQLESSSGPHSPAKHIKPMTFDLKIAYNPWCPEGSILLGYSWQDITVEGLFRIRFTRDYFKRFTYFCKQPFWTFYARFHQSHGMIWWNGSLNGILLNISSDNGFLMGIRL